MNKDLEIKAYIDKVYSTKTKIIKDSYEINGKNNDKDLLSTNNQNSF